MTNNIAINTENLKENCLTLSIPKMYSVDFNKVNSFEDLKNVVQILFTGLPITISEDCGFIDEIREYLIELD
ncbi:MAG: hypothetical protein ACLVEC_01210 [Romboutsia timonensis]